MIYRELKHYKYQLLADEVILLSAPLPSAQTDFIVLEGRKLICKKYYAWDGLSGPSFDTKRTKIGSLAHDALYQLMRKGLLPRTYKKFADAELKRLLIKCGVSRFYADIVHKGVQIFGKKYTYPEKNPRGKIVTITK